VVLSEPSLRIVSQVKPVAKEGDIIVIWKLDRLARSTHDLLDTIETIREAEGGFPVYLRTMS
jgi:DNA invertase Pin-like site-specific DNA recombinase